MSDRVRDACEASFDAHRHDCSGFVRAVGSVLGVEIDGLANEIVDALRDGGGWVRLTDGVAAAASAAGGNLVLAGLRGDEQSVPNRHGHVAVIVAGPLEHNRYPSAYWGSLGGNPGRFRTINWAWTTADRDRVTYAVHRI